MHELYDLEGGEKVLTDTMALPRTLKGADRRKRKALPDPRTLPLWRLIEIARLRCTWLANKSELGVFEAAYGDKEQALRSFTSARATGDDVLVRSFLVACLKREARKVLAALKKKASA